MDEVTDLRKRHRQVGSTFVYFGKQKKMAAVYEEAKVLEDYLNMQERIFTERLGSLDRDCNVLHGSAYVTTSVLPAVELVRDQIHDFTLMRKLLISKVGQPPDEVCCAICLDMLFHPVTLVCRHRFCKHCLKLATKHNKRCPVCRRPDITEQYVEELELNSFLKKRYPSLYRERKADRFQRQQQEYEQILLMYEETTREARQLNNARLQARNA
eukprot:Plantae.Rhodophyta-Purpureofilum_apyrenoidigerum.ctg19878.p1 GENE.Plantae.Rhodophyta-Purpureofilum_apyrenoidigerum.ctg19878~~Plantae.Rhodophyta-Purpureofilum_apyrenoidigerum.ctg19878.p1  ORF type:complete len:229 (-),score=32.40 Plantae.Rhodophyta-Purpureofilum_apyrenoidigerum.ctg19878:63-701(-)